MHRLARLLVIAFLLGMPLASHATVLYTEPSQIQIKPNERFEVSVFLDTQSEDINALEGKVQFSSEILELEEVRDGNSIVNFWVERPTKSTSPVTFSGIIPGGYQFPKGLVVSFVFHAKQEGQGVISIENARTLRNDGEGTQTPLSVTFTSVRVSQDVITPSLPVTAISDTDAPESFVPHMSRDASIFDGKWFLSFATQDKASGISGYEVSEEYAWGRGPWIPSESPYVLRGQDPTRSAFVKAIDRAGNERIERVAPAEARDPIYDLVAILGILLVVIVMLAIVYGKRIRFRR
ncbi:MAG: hypothetical protein WC787_02300 [Patescibacteria group bacterium]|jgi:hypothetical protein